MAKKIFIVYLDILGYTNKINRYKPEELAEEMKYIIQKETKYPFASFTYHGDPDENIDTHGIKHAIASDTILLYTKGKSSIEFDFLIRHVTNLFITLLINYYPLRGVIDFGELYANKKDNIYLGKALVNAHNEAKKPDWAGVMLTDNCEKEITRDNDFRELIEALFKIGWLTKCEVPLKSEFDDNNGIKLKIDYKEEHSIINWAPGLGRFTPVNENDFRKFFIGPNNELKILKPDVEKKIQNTYSYYLAHYKDQYI